MACRLADAAREVHARGKPDIRRMRRDRRNELWEEHVSARPIRYFAAIALWALPNHAGAQSPATAAPEVLRVTRTADDGGEGSRSEEHTSELQSHLNLVCRLLL